MDAYRSGFVTLIGRPNVGKSSLLNQLVGQKIAIMSDKPQTTRNKILGIYTAEACQIVFIDTPGVHKPRHKLGEYMAEVTRNSLEEVDCILYVYDGNQTFGAGEEFILQLLASIKTPVILLINKIDLMDKKDLLPLIETMSRRFPFAEIIPVSALTGENVAYMLTVLAQYIPEGPQYYPAEMITDQPERFIMAEIIREKVLMLTQEEIPHAVAVQIESLVERSPNTVYVGAVIYLERDSQKGIIIGKGGQMLKEIGTRSRGEIEHLLGSKIFLDLRVKVKADWRRQSKDLSGLGYDLREI